MVLMILSVVLGLSTTQSTSNWITQSPQAWAKKETVSQKLFLYICNESGNVS
jgi:hypothetical protein